jgi:hypothetical protein
MSSSAAKRLKMTDAKGSYMAYRQMLRLVEEQRFSELSEKLNSLREGSWLNEQTRRLLSARVSLLSGHSDISLDILDLRDKDAAWVEAEGLFVQGLALFHQGEFVSGGAKFTEAADQFHDQAIVDRHFLARFNAYVGRVNSDDLFTVQERLAEIQFLERSAYPHRAERAMHSVLALILREKAVLLYQDKRYRAALDYATQAAALFRESGTIGDWHLSLLLASLSAFRSGQIETAHLHLEQVAAPLEARVEFAHDLMRSLLGVGSTPDPKSYTVCSPFWREVAESLQAERAQSLGAKHIEATKEAIGADEARVAPSASGVIITTEATDVPIEIQVKAETGLIRNRKSGVEYKVSPRGLDIRILRLLARGRCSRSYLIEALWPESAHSEQLDNRLHQLLYRVKNRYGIVIQFDGHAYQLQSKIEIC